jgi:pimeloyl-ACP methyl ester carboxylesterase
MIATSGRAQLAYDSTGAEVGADVLLIHAGVNDRRGWQHVVERLGRRHRCVAYDIRGFGETTYEPEDGWSPMGDALAVLDAAGMERPVVVACSMGGQAAIDLALAHPDRVAALLLIGTAVRGAPYPDLREGPTAELNARIEAAGAAGDIDEVGRLEAWMWLDGPAAEEAELAPAWPRLREITAHTLVMIGRLDAEDILVIDEQVARLIPGARLRYLDGVAHVPHLEGDPATLDEIAAFVDERSSRLA